jgi:hypothetical protein
MKWEYMVVSPGPMHLTGWDNWLTGFGSEGWELASVVPANAVATEVIFKRKVKKGKSPVPATKKRRVTTPNHS